MNDYLLSWCLCHGAPPEVASAVVAAARPPVSPARDALARAVVALEAEAIADPASAEGRWAEAGARMALWVLCLGGAR